MSKLSIQKSIGRDGLFNSASEWGDLWAKTSRVPFLSWDWTFTWAEKLSGTREICLLKAYREKKLIGILPLCRRKRVILGKTLETLAFLGEESGGADYLDILAADEDKGEIWAAAFDFLREQNDIDEVSLENLAGSSLSASILDVVGDSDGGFRFNRKDLSICPQIDLQPEWPSILGQSRRKDNFKRRLKKLEKMDGFEFRSVTDPGETGAAFERFVCLHDRRWLKLGGSEVTGEPELLEFHREVIRRLSGIGLIRFDEIWVEGECRASVYGLDNGRTFYYYNAGYDQEWAEKSVGLVLLGCSIRAAIGRGNVLYDFLRGDEGYKFDWSNKVERLISIKFFRAGFFGWFDQTSETLWSDARQTVKTLLPKEVAARLQAFRRNRLRTKRVA